MVSKLCNDKQWFSYVHKNEVTFEFVKNALLNSFVLEPLNQLVSVHISRHLSLQLAWRDHSEAREDNVAFLHTRVLQIRPA